MSVVIGIDPGRTTGIAVLEWYEDAAVNVNLIQCNPAAVQTIVGCYIELCEEAQHPVRALAVEQFVAGPRSGKLATPAGAAQARFVIGDAAALAEERGVAVYLRNAGAVKPWASDARLDKIAKERRGMPHAADALRHALFCAVRDFGFPDPLSRYALRTPKGDAPHATRPGP